MTDRLGESAIDAGFEVQTYALSAAVYVERDDEILLLKRAEGTALAGQWFIPGGAVEPGELPEEGARRELREEAGIHIEGDLELVGAYPLYAYGVDILQLTYRGQVPDDTEVAISGEHDGAMWVRPADMRALLNDDFVEEVAQGDERIRSILGHVTADLDRYMARVR